LRECVLELLPLSGDHSGKASGKLIFKALSRQGIDSKLSKCSTIVMVIKSVTYSSAGANGADNASSNRQLNRTVSKYLWKVSNVHVNAVNMQVGCGGHVVNIACQ
jgi:hypothetical protein